MRPDQNDPHHIKGVMSQMDCTEDQARMILHRDGILYDVGHREGIEEGKRVIRVVLGVEPMVPQPRTANWGDDIDLDFPPGVDDV